VSLGRAHVLAVALPTSVASQVQPVLWRNQFQGHDIEQLVWTVCRVGRLGRIVLRAFNYVDSLPYKLCRMSSNSAAMATNGRHVIDCQYVPFLSSIVSVVVVFDLLSYGLVFCLPILSVCAVCVWQFVSCDCLTVIVCECEFE
jgi:hypothetical protein